MPSRTASPQMTMLPTVVDCAEGTVRQFAQQPFYGHNRLRVSRLSKVFITHMHGELACMLIFKFIRIYPTKHLGRSTADHTMGLTTLLRTLLGIPPAHSPLTSTPLHARAPPSVELYGPPGLRALLRATLTLTRTRSVQTYAVHELLGPGDVPSATCGGEEAHESECVGRDVRCDEEGVWRGVVDVEEGRGRRRVVVDAAPIEHRGAHRLLD